MTRLHTLVAATLISTAVAMLTAAPVTHAAGSSITGITGGNDPVTAPPPEMPTETPLSYDTAPEPRKRTPSIATDTVPGQKLTIKQVMELLKTSKDLSGRNMSGMQLTGINFSKCNLSGADLSRANLERADFSQANVERIDFSGANLRMASFHLAGMTGVNLEQAVLDGAIWTDRTVCAQGSLGFCRDMNDLQPTPASPPPAVTPPAPTPAPVAPATPAAPAAPVKPAAVTPPAAPATPATASVKPAAK